MESELPRDPVIEAVRADLLRRQQHGYLKYGNTLATNPSGLLGKLQHVYEEALDLCNYLKWSLMQLEGRPELAPDPTGNTGLSDFRRRCKGGDVLPDGSCIACFAKPGQDCLSPAATR